MRTLLIKVPDWLKKALLRAWDSATALLYCGKGRYCPICGRSSRRFRPFGVIRRADARCGHCGSLERHRFVWLFFLKRTSLFEGHATKMLHVAPEECFELRLREQLSDTYLTADLLNQHAMVKMDVCDIQFPDHSFDVIYCSHVLEHVLDDRQAMREFFRVLKKGGWAILNVPIAGDKTVEDPSIVDPEQRLRAFGQTDHVRRYGSDYVHRLRDAGFAVDTIRVRDLVDHEEALRMGLTHASGEIFYCTK